MKAYQPKVRVRLVKVVKREGVAKGLPSVDARYKDNPGFDLTPFMGDAGGLRLSKSVFDPAGGFSLTFADKPHLLETVYAMIEPMDMLEIRFAHDPYDYAKEWKGYDLPIVMRGLVSNVTRSEAMQDGRPVRTVTVAGQDFGKILQTIQIFYLKDSVVGDNILSWLAFFQKYSVIEKAKIKPVKVFLEEVLSDVINPYLAKLLQSTRAGDVGAKALKPMKLECSIPGSISPHVVSSFSGGSLFDLLRLVLDIGPFNELFLRDDADYVTLVARPAPLRNPNGDWINPAITGKSEATFVDIPSLDVEHMQVSRTDAGVANYYWVDNTRWTMMQNETAKSLSMTGPADDYIKFSYPNALASMYGVRKMEVGITLGEPLYSEIDNPPANILPKETRLLGDWLHARRKVLADINKDNVIFEQGILRVRGNERIKPGMYVRLTRGVGGVVSEFYVRRVDHDISPMRRFSTTLTVERGNGFINRAGETRPAYLGEIDAGGVK